MAGAAKDLAALSVLVKVAGLSAGLAALPASTRALTPRPEKSADAKGGEDVE